MDTCLSVKFSHLERKALDLIDGDLSDHVPSYLITQLVGQPDLEVWLAALNFFSFTVMESLGFKGWQWFLVSCVLCHSLTDPPTSLFSFKSDINYQLLDLK